MFDEEHPTQVGLAGQAIAIAGPLKDAAGQLDYDVATSEVPDLAAGREMVADGSLDALVSGAPAELRVLVRGDVDPDLRTVLNGLVQQQVLSGLLASVEDLDANQVLATVAKAGVHVDSLEPADPQHNQRLALALVVVALLYLALLLYGSMVAQGVVEEKSSRVVELLLATVRPGQLLTGKVLGLGLVGLIQLFAVGAVGLLLAIGTSVVTLTGAAASTLAWGLLWYVLGYLLYATVFAAVGSLVSRQEDVQSVLMPITVVLVVAFVLGFAVLSRNPTGHDGDRAVPAAAAVADPHAGPHRARGGPAVAGRPGDRPHGGDGGAAGPGGQRRLPQLRAAPGPPPAPARRPALSRASPTPGHRERWTSRVGSVQDSRGQRSATGT